MGWGAIGNSLTEMTAKGEITPDLAESFEPSDEAKKWVFKLRKGVTFHNGKNVTAATSWHPISTTWARIRSRRPSRSSPASTHQGRRRQRGVHAEGSQRRLPVLTARLSHPIMPAEGQRRRLAVGHPHRTFQAGEVRAGVSARWSATTISIRMSGSTIYMLCIPDVAARTAALTAGEVDYMDRCDLKTLDLVKATPGIKISEVTGYGHYVIPMNVTVAPFNDVTSGWRSNTHRPLRRS